MRSSRKFLTTCCLIVASFGISSWTPASAQEKAARPELQQQFSDALKFYNDRQYDKAAAELDKILKLNPSSEEAMSLRQTTDMALLVKMLQEPKVGKQIRILLLKSEQAAVFLPHDSATIQGLIDKTASDDIAVHWSAIRQLTAIGALAVPQLLDTALSNERMTTGSRKVAAFIVLHSMGTAATPPLIVALRHCSDADADAMANLLSKNPDARAVPPLAAMAENSARPQNVRKAASDALATILAASTHAARSDAAESYFTLAQRYYYADPVLLALTSDAERGIWRWNAQGKSYAECLAFDPLPRAAYARLMAAEAIHAGMEQTHSSSRLLELFICNNYMMLEEAADMKDKAADPQAVKAANESLGAEYLYQALGRALHDSNQPLARRCVEALANVGDSRPPRENTLITAMTYPDKFVRIEAALALVQLSPVGSLGGADEVARVMAASLGAPVRPRVVVLTADEDLFKTLANTMQGSDLAFEMQPSSAEVVRRVKELASPLSVLVIDTRVEGDKTLAVVDSLHADVWSSRLPVVLLAPIGDIEKLRSAGQRRIAAVMALNAAPAQVKIAIVNASATSRGTVATEDVRDNVALLSRILQAVAVLPPDTRYPTEELTIAAAGFLTNNQPKDMRILALRTIGHLPLPVLQGSVFEIFAATAEPVEVRREAGAALQKLLIVNPRISPHKQAQLRALVHDADESLRTCAIHGLALASISQAEREAALIEASAPPAAAIPAVTTSAAVAPAATAPAAPKPK